MHSYFEYICWNCWSWGKYLLSLLLNSNHLRCLRAYMYVYRPIRSTWAYFKTKLSSRFCGFFTETFSNSWEIQMLPIFFYKNLKILRKIFFRQIDTFWSIYDDVFVKLERQWQPQQPHQQWRPITATATKKIVIMNNGMSVAFVCRRKTPISLLSH